MGRRRLTPADDLIAPAVGQTIAALSGDDVDAGAVQLAKRYAALIDDAREAAALADEIYDRLPVDDIDGRRQLAKLAAKVEAQAVLADLGPKLLTALDALGATPTGRARIKAGGAPGAGPNRLAALRQARQA